MRRWFLPALLLAVAVLIADPARAQSDGTRHVAVHSEGAESDASLDLRGRLDTAVEELAASNGLRSLGSEAWPLVRKYVWLSTYAGDDLFAGYSQPLSDADDGEMPFHLLIDRSRWSASEPAVRQKKLFEAQARFEDRMAELNLKGSMHIVLTSR